MVVDKNQKSMLVIVIDDGYSNIKCQEGEAREIPRAERGFRGN